MAGYRTVLAVIDGSPSSEVGAEVAAELAESSGGTLHVGGAVLPEGSHVDLGDAAEMTQPGTREFTEQLQEHVRVVADGVRERHECDVEITMIDGNGGHGLTDHERRLGVDLTVVGVRVDDAQDREPGRLRAEVMRAAPSPILLIPSTDREAQDGMPREPFHPDAVVAVLGATVHDATASVPSHAAALARQLGADLWLVTPPAGSGLLDAAAAGHGRDESGSLSALVDELRARGLGVGSEEIAGADPFAALVDFIREHGVGTVAVGPEGHALAERLLLEQGPGAEEEGGPGRVSVLLCPPEPPRA